MFKPPESKSISNLDKANQNKFPFSKNDNNKSDNYLKFDNKNPQISFKLDDKKSQFPSNLIEISTNINNIKENANNNNNNSIQTEQSQSTEIIFNKTITQNDSDNAPYLTIKEIEGNQLQNKIIKLNAAGYSNGARKKNDGTTLFGPSLTDENNNIINDIAIAHNLKESNTHLMIIYYKKEENKYYIRTYKDHLINGLSYILVKIKESFYIRCKDIMMIGDLFFDFRAEKKGNNNLQLTIRKLISKRSPQEEIFTFNSSSYEKPITIGRDRNCVILFENDMSFSKIHCTICFNRKEAMWEIQDGSERKKSTNGIWLVPKHSFEIYDGLLFKIIGCSKFVININKEKEDSK